MSKPSKRKRNTRPAPDDCLGHFDLGNQHRQNGDLTAAEASYRRAVALEPAFVSAWNNLGTVFKARGRNDAAMDCYLRALALQPDYAMAHNNLGVALLDAGHHTEAAASCRRAVEIEPGYFRAHYNLGKALHELGRYDEAMACHSHALALRPDLAEAHSGLANALQAVGRIADSVEHYRSALALRPDHDKSVSSLLFVLNYLAGQPPAAMLAEARRYGERVRARATPYRAWRGRPDPDRRLRVGFVSGDLVNHPVGFFLEATLAALDPAAVELYAYANNAREDALTRRIQPCFAVWRRVDALDDAALARRIHDDAVDILIDLSGHTALNRLPVFAWRPAPVQASWLGYFATTGVPGIDYFLADRQVCPAGEEAHFSETVLRLPDAYYCFTPPDLDIAPSPPPALADGRITFGCFNRLAKMNDAVVATWARVLAAVPGAHLFLKAAELGDEAQRQAVRERYAAQGVDPGRLLFEGETPRPDYLAAYRRVDIALDPFPYPGGTTTAEGLWMGVPALTLRGDRFIGHQGETLLANAGLPGWIADDPDDYVAKAAALAADLPALAALRTGLRRQLLASPLCDAPRFAANLEAALRGAWRRWCAGG